MSAAVTPLSTASVERKAEIIEQLAEIRERVKAASSAETTLIAVSKYKPPEDLLVCFEEGQRDFGENYVQELESKAKLLPPEIRWHFIGNLQSNKAKTLAAIPNLHTMQTLSSMKTATALDKYLPEERLASPLNVLIQVNTSGEDSKSGLYPQSDDIKNLARHVITTCSKLRLQGLMTIGALERSKGGEEGVNEDFEMLKKTRDWLKGYLDAEFGSEKWGDEGKRLLLSMGMSGDFEVALKAGSDIVRVGTGIFGARMKKEEIKVQKQ